jgi:ABC-2 type transport system permease protein
MTHVFLWELSRRKMFTVWWSIGVSSLISITVLAFLAVKDQAAEFDKAFSELSGSAGAFLGGSDLFSPIGYLSSQIYFILLPLLLIIMTVTLASSLMSKDESDGTVELALSRPVSRRGLMFGKLLAGLIILLIVCIVSYLVVAVCVGLVDMPINQWHLLLTHLLSFAFSASFGLIAFTLMAVSRLTRQFAGVVAIVLSFGGYLISSLAGFVDGLKWVAEALPYHYYNTADLLVGKIDPGLIIYLVGILVVAIFAMWIGYSRRDIG